MLFINSVSLLLTLIGLYGHLNINIICIGLHSILITAIIGAFCLYTVIEIIVFLTLEVLIFNFYYLHSQKKIMIY